MGSLEGHTRGVRALAFAEGLLCSGSEDNSIRLWDRHYCVRGWCLASVPESEYKAALQVVDKRGGFNATGIASDRLNSTVIDHGWKDAMRIKLTHVCEELSRRRCERPYHVVVAIVIVGGPACDWERWHMTDVPGITNSGGQGPRGQAPDGAVWVHTRSLYPMIRLKACTNAIDMENFIERGLPYRECV